MKIKFKNINRKTNTFIVKLILEIDTDDCWNLYNLINKGDIIQGHTYRKIVKETATGMVSNIKKKIMCAVRVLQCDFDGDTDVIRITGMNA